MSTLQQLCPENKTWVGTTGFGDECFEQGPHHWTRVGTFPHIEVVPYSNEGHYVKNPDTLQWEQITPLTGYYEKRVDKLIWECVYCLQIKRQE